MSRGIRGGIIFMFAMISNWLFQFIGFHSFYAKKVWKLLHEDIFAGNRTALPPIGGEIFEAVQFLFQFHEWASHQAPGGQQGRQQRAGISTPLGYWENILMKIFSAWKVPHFEAQSCKICLRGGGKYKYAHCYVANLYLDNLWLCIFRYLLICQFVYLWIYFVCG